MQEWENFKSGKWQQVIDVENFILNNYKEYLGSSDFLKGISKKTNRVWSRCQKLLEKEIITSVLDIETNYFSGIDSFEPGFIDKKSEVIVGLQTDDPLKLFVNPYISLNTSLQAIKSYGYRFDKDNVAKFSEYCESYEDIVDSLYTDEIKKYKKLHLLEGLPDNFGRGFILGDYRRLALYGANYLIAKKKSDLQRLKKNINYSMIRTREEVVKQIDALEELKNMALRYGYDISLPARNAKEAVQWLYFGYLSAIKQTNGAFIPIGNNTTFLDIYIERDINRGLINEIDAQELIDQFVIKLRMVRFLHIPEYYTYFLGKNPIITETIGGVFNEKSLITKTAYRFLNSIVNLDSYPTPNYLVMWSRYLPSNFKKYCSKIVLKYNCIGFINDDYTKSNYASNGIASISNIGKQIDYYGGTCNLPKILLYAVNGGRDEITGEKVIDGIEPIKSDILDFPTVINNFSIALKKMVNIQADAANIIHCIHDKYVYESSIMAFNDTIVERYITFSISGLSTVCDSLSAIRSTIVKVNRDENGLSKDFIVKDKYSRFGNNLDDVDKLAHDIIKLYSRFINEYNYYRNAKPKIGISSSGLNLVYGKNTGATPDGRFSNVPFAMGVNPTSNVDSNGVLNCLKSILKIPKELCSAGIITTLNINSSALGNKTSEYSENIIRLLDEFFYKNGNQVEFNIMDKNDLLEAYNKNDKFNNLIVRSCGYSIRYSDLNDEQQDNLIDMTYHKVL